MEKIIHDVENDTITVVDLTKMEIDTIKKQYKELEEKTAPFVEALAEKEKNRNSALAKLAALGLTEKEIAAL